MLNQDLKKIHPGTPELNDVCPITPASLGSSISFIMAGACAYTVVARELFTSNARGNGHTIPIYLYLKLALPVWCLPMLSHFTISLTLPYPLCLVTIAVVSSLSTAASPHCCQVPRNSDGHLLCEPTLDPFFEISECAEIHFGRIRAVCDDLHDHLPAERLPIT